MRFKRLNSENWNHSEVNPGSLRLIKPRFLGHASHYTGPQAIDLDPLEKPVKSMISAPDTRPEIELTVCKAGLT